MINWKYFFIGGFGSILPALLNLYFVDPRTTFVAVNFGVLAGYLIRNLIGYCLGGLSVCFDKVERDPWTLIRLGIAAPALFAAMINGQAVTPAVSQISFSSTVEASEPERYLEGFPIRSFEKEKPSSFLTGFSGAPENRFYVVVGAETPRQDQAIEAATKIRDNLKKRNLLKDKTAQIVIYEPYQKLGFTIIVAEKVIQNDADEIVSMVGDSDLSVRVFDIVCGCFVEKTATK
jgi:hypothetical protein